MVPTEVEINEQDKTSDFQTYPYVFLIAVKLVSKLLICYVTNIIGDMYVEYIVSVCMYGYGYNTLGAGSASHEPSPLFT